MVNANGSMMMNGSSQGPSTIRVPTSQLANGAYFIQFIATSGEIKAVPIVVIPLTPRISPMTFLNPFFYLVLRRRVCRCCFICSRGEGHAGWNSARSGSFRSLKKLPCAPSRYDSCSCLLLRTLLIAALVLAFARPAMKGYLGQFPLVPPMLIPRWFFSLITLQVCRVRTIMVNY